MADKIMSFDVSQTEFLSERSKDIWFLGKSIVPLEISLAEITDSEMREGCTQIYQFTRGILSDMYIEPEKYPPQKFDLLFNQFIKFGAKIDETGFNWSIPNEVYIKYTKRFGDSEILVSALQIIPKARS